MLARIFGIRAEKGEHRTYTSVVSLGGRQLELPEDALHMRFHGAFADGQFLSDGAVAQTVGHQRKNFPLPR